MKAALISNPQAGTKRLNQQLTEAKVYLQKQGWQIDWHQTQYAGHATRLAREDAARNEDAVMELSMR